MGVLNLGQVVGPPGPKGDPASPNLLENWYFADPINQRRLEEYTGSGYTIDRWKLNGNASSLKYNVAQRKLSCAPTTTAYLSFEQLIESPSRFTGKILTYSALFESAKKVIIQIWKTNSSGTISLATSGNWTDSLFLSFTFKMPEDITDSDTIRVLIQTQDNVVPIAAKLELGSLQTLAHQDAAGNWVLNDPPPNKALELLKCQRYQMQVYGVGNAAYVVFGVGVAISDTDCVIAVPLPIKMRIAIPSLIADASKFRINNTIAITSITLSNVSASIAKINIKCSGGLKAGEAVFLTNVENIGTSASFLLDANL